MQLTLGPIPFFWPKADVIDFYERMLEQPLDRIYLGETVCSKRRELRAQDWLDLAQVFSEQGKQVVLSSLTLVEAESEIKQMVRLCRQSDFLVEANDIAAIQLLRENQSPFVAGPAINIYNGYSLRKLQSLGMQRWVMPVELSRQSLQTTLHQGYQLGNHVLPETEIFAYGQLPLAYAARCFTARHRNLAKDNCGFCCIEYPQGINLASQSGGPLFTMNGIQTLSAKTYNLLEQLTDMNDLGVDAVRLSPTGVNMEAVIQAFRNALCKDKLSSDSCDNAVNSMQNIPLHTIEEQCNGYWFGEPGMDINVEITPQI